jgi:predicted component of type VI protein secretion system
VRLNRNAFVAVLAILCAAFYGCASKPPIAFSKNSSAIAISVSIESMTSPLMTEKVRPNHIFFIKLNESGGSLKSRDVIVSNYMYEPIMHAFQTHTVDSFAMNLDAGIYAAVGAIATGYTSNINFLIFFPEDMIRSTITEVSPDRIKYMGRYTLDRMNFVGMMATTQMDDPQAFYYKNNIFDLLMLENRKSVVYNFHKPIRIMVTLDNSDRSKETEIEFLLEHMKTFEATEWTPKLQNQIKKLRSHSN